MAEEVARRLDSISMRGRLLSLKILKRDPSAPKEAPKVRQVLHLLWVEFEGHSSSWVMGCANRSTSRQH